MAANFPGHDTLYSSKKPCPRKHGAQTQWGDNKDVKRCAWEEETPHLNKRKKWCGKYLIGFYSACALDIHFTEYMLVFQETSVGRIKRELVTLCLVPV